MLTQSRRLGLLLCGMFAGLVQAAWADCAGNTSAFEKGACEAQVFAQTDTTLTLSIQQLSQTLPPAGQTALVKAQTDFLRQREKTCEKTAATGTFIDFSCATRLTQARLAALKVAAAAPVSPAKYTGEYKLQATSMPWFWQKDGLNSQYQFGKQDGIGPLALAFSGIGVAPGQALVVRYVSGQVTVGKGWLAVDANGVTSPYDSGGAGLSGAPMPSTFMTARPVHFGELTGAFTDPTGALVAAPFALGDGPVLATAPAGATQLELGLNDDTSAGNTGALVVSVVPAPPGGVQGIPVGAHGCAMFGGSAGPSCENFPKWSSGIWLPPPGKGPLHVVLVGGGGGGASDTFVNGVGGTGGGSGEIVDATIPTPDAPIQVTVGQHGPGAAQVTLPGINGGDSTFAGLHAAGGIGGQLSSGGSSTGNGGYNGGGGGGGGTYETSFDAGAGGAGGTGGTVGTNGVPPSDVEDGFNSTAGGAGSPYPNFNFRWSTFTPGSGGSGGTFGAGGVNAAGVSCAGGGGGGGGGGGLMANNTGPSAKPAYYLLLHQACGQVGGNGQGGTGYGAGGGGAGGGIAGPAGDGANGMVYVEW